MKIYDEYKMQEIINPDLSTGKLVEDKIFVAHHDAVPAIIGKTSEQIAREMAEEGKEVFYNEKRGLWYYVEKKFSNGGRSVKAIYPIQAVPEKEAWDEYEDIFVYIPYTATELVDLQREELRQRRSTECFPIINRGALWYEKLTSDQRSELSEWYEKWLNAPQTLSAPTAPSWIDEKVNE